MGGDWSTRGREFESRHWLIYHIYLFQNTGLLSWPFCLFLTFHTTQIKYKLIRALMVCLGLEPGAAGWKVQTNPLSYGDITQNTSLLFLEKTKNK